MATHLHLFKECSLIPRPSCLQLLISCGMHKNCRGSPGRLCHVHSMWRNTRYTHGGFQLLIVCSMHKNGGRSNQSNTDDRQGKPALEWAVSLPGLHHHHTVYAPSSQVGKRWDGIGNLNGQLSNSLHQIRITQMNSSNSHIRQTPFPKGMLLGSTPHPPST